MLVANQLRITRSPREHIMPVMRLQGGIPVPLPSGCPPGSRQTQLTRLSGMAPAGSGSAGPLAGPFPPLISALRRPAIHPLRNEAPQYRTAHRPGALPYISAGRPHLAGCVESLPRLREVHYGALDIVSSLLFVRILVRSRT
jgi:hypothetical protein